LGLLLSSVGAVFFIPTLFSPERQGGKGEHETRKRSAKGRTHKRGRKGKGKVEGRQTVHHSGWGDVRFWPERRKGTQDGAVQKKGGKGGKMKIRLGGPFMISFVLSIRGDNEKSGRVTA